MRRCIAPTGDRPVTDGWARNRSSGPPSRSVIGGTISGLSRGYPRGMVMLGVHVGAREDDGDPVAEAAASGADGVQVFLADPQGWKTPKAHPHAEAMRAAELTVFVHAPYIVNVATTNNRIRIPSRKLLAAHAKAAAETGASGLIVHGGHVLAKDDPAGRLRQLAQGLRATGRGGRLPAAGADREHRRRRQGDDQKPGGDRPAVGCRG